VQDRAGAATFWGVLLVVFDHPSLLNTTAGVRVCAGHLHYPLQTRQSTNADYDCRKTFAIGACATAVHCPLQESFLDEGFILDKRIGVGQPKRIENANILVANTAMDTDKIKIYGARVRVDSMQKVQLACICQPLNLLQQHAFFHQSCKCYYMYVWARWLGVARPAGPTAPITRR
jgi:hypothetical protein